MSGTEKIFEGKKFLVIEDDDGLAARMEYTFEFYGAKTTKKYWIDAGLEELQKNSLEYNLIIVDVMLPQTEEDFMEIKEYKSLLEDNQKVLMQRRELELSGEGGDKLETARQDRKEYYKQIGLRIRREGGIEMVKTWIEQSGNPEERPPILYLTAIGDEDIAKKAKEITGKKVEWLVKEVTQARLIETVGSLIGSVRRTENTGV